MRKAAWMEYSESGFSARVQVIRLEEHTIKIRQKTSGEDAGLVLGVLFLFRQARLISERINVVLPEGWR